MVSVETPDRLSNPVAADASTDEGGGAPTELRLRGMGGGAECRAATGGGGGGGAEGEFSGTFDDSEDGFWEGRNEGLWDKGPFSESVDGRSLRRDRSLSGASALKDFRSGSFEARSPSPRSPSGFRSPRGRALSDFRSGSLEARSPSPRSPSGFRSPRGRALSDFRSGSLDVRAPSGFFSDFPAIDDAVEIRGSTPLFFKSSPVFPSERDEFDFSESAPMVPRPCSSIPGCFSNAESRVGILPTCSIR